MNQAKKVFPSPLVLLLRHMYLLPEAMKVSRCCPEREGSTMIALALLRPRMLTRSSVQGKGLPVICCVVLMTL